MIFTEVTGYGVVLNSEVTPVGQQKYLPLKMLPSDLVNALFNRLRNGYFFVSNKVVTNKSRQAPSTHAPKRKIFSDFLNTLDVDERHKNRVTEAMVSRLHARVCQPANVKGRSHSAVFLAMIASATR